MGFKLPMDGFKKVSEDKHKTLLRHDSGHEITIAHAPLSHKMRSQLKSLPMADGGKVEHKGNYKLQEAYAEHSKGPKWVRKAQEGNSAMPGPQAMPSEMAEGGNVDPQPQPSPTSTPKAPVDPDKWKAFQSGFNKAEGGEVASNPARFADGGDVQEPSQAEGIGKIIGHAVRAAVGDTADAVKTVTTPVMNAGKGFVNGVMGRDAQAAEPTPVLAQPQVDPAFQQAQDALTQASAPSTPTALNQQQDSGTAPVQPQGPTSPLNTVPQEPGEEIPGVGADNQPGLEEGYKNQVIGEQNQAQALAAQGQRDASNFKQTAGQEANLLDQFNTHSSDMNNEIQNFVSDINNDHINPHELWDSKSGLDKARIGIGFILSGMGAGITGGPNLAVEMLNKNIDRDIDAQKANLGTKENLLGAMFKQYGNMRDATDMTRILMNAHNQDMIKASAAKAQSPLAKAAAQNAIGKLQDAIAPTIYQMNMRKTLMSVGGGQGAQANGTLSHVDPAVFLNTIPEQAARDKAGAEIERAQNTKRMEVPILQGFDQADKDLSGLGRVEGMVQEPGSINKLTGLLNTTVTDLTGTARTAEFENVKHNFVPSPTDTPAKRAYKRESLIDYLQAKKSAPFARSYNIDLEKFDSTANNPIALLPPHQQRLANWAQANPSNPKAQLVLKKLRLQ